MPGAFDEPLSPRRPSERPRSLDTQALRTSSDIDVDGDMHMAEAEAAGTDRPGRLAGSDYVATLQTVSPTTLGNDEIDKQCVLCRSTYTKDPVITPCKHAFCEECILSWLSEDKANQNTCPMCRRELFQKHEEEGISIGDNGYVEELFRPLTLYDDDYLEGRLREDYEEIRDLITENRRIGALADCDLYELLRADGADLPALAPEDCILNLLEDRAVFDELESRGAFALPGMERQLRTRPHRTAADMYEILRDSGANWCVGHARWRVGRVHLRFG